MRGMVTGEVHHRRRLWRVLMGFGVLIVIGVTVTASRK
jgi:hypothetical protein